MSGESDEITSSSEGSSMFEKVPRVKVRINGQIGGGKWIAVKATTFEQFLGELSKSFNMKVEKIFDCEGIEHENLDSIRDGELLFIAPSNSEFIDLAPNFGSLRPPISGQWTLRYPSPRIVSQVTHEDFTDRIFKAVEEATKLATETEGWVKTASQLDCIGSFKRVRGEPFCTFKGIGDIKVPLDVAERTYRTLAKGTSIQDFLKEVKILEELSDSVYITQRTYKGRYCFTKFGYETVVLTCWAKSTDGSEMAVVIPVEHPNAKESKSSTRFSIRSSCVLFQPKLGNPKHTICTVIFQPDVSKFPEAIFNLVARKFPLGARTVARIRKGITGSITNDEAHSPLAIVRKELSTAIGLHKTKFVFAWRTSSADLAVPSSGSPSSPKQGTPRTPNQTKKEEESQNPSSLPDEDHYLPLDGKQEGTSDELISEKLIGTGNFGNVYRGSWRGFVCAIKILKPEHQARNLDAFQAEAELMMCMEPHVNVVTFYALVPEPLCILTEYCSNGCLNTLLNSVEELDRPIIIKIIKGIASGMAHIHKSKVIHRDLACRNILLSENFEPKISDFGLSRILESNEIVGITDSTIGPIRHMAAECLIEKKYSIKSDVWSYGVTLFEIIQREQPYKTLPTVQVGSLVAAGQLELQLSPQKEAEWPEIKTLMANCMKFKPELRPTFPEVIQYLLQEFK